MFLIYAIKRMILENDLEISSKLDAYLESIHINMLKIGQTYMLQTYLRKHVHDFNVYN